MALDVFALINREPGGFQFQVIGEVHEDLFDLMSQMVLRIRRLLAHQHLSIDPNIQTLAINDLLVRGRMTWDPDADGRVPLLVIDGQEVSWDALGRMLTCYEGFQFKLEIRDKSEEI